MIRCLWDCQVDAIIDIKLGDNDADTYKYEPMIALLARSENINKDKHGKHCHDQLLVPVLQTDDCKTGERRPAISPAWIWHGPDVLGVRCVQMLR